MLVLGFRQFLRELLDEPQFGLQQRHPVLLLDEEDPLDAVGRRLADHYARLVEVFRQRVGTGLQQLHGFHRVQHGDERQRHAELRVLVHRVADEFAHPVVQFGAAGAGQRVDRAFGPLNLMLRSLPVSVSLFTPLRL